MALVVGAYAAEGHDHGEPAKAEPGASRAGGRADIRPNLKALAKKRTSGGAGRGVTRGPKEAGKDSAKESGKDATKAGAKAGAKAPGKGTTVDPTDPKSDVSMSDLRDLIDQKVAEVRPTGASGGGTRGAHSAEVTQAQIAGSAGHVHARARGQHSYPSWRSQGIRLVGARCETNA